MEPERWQKIEQVYNSALKLELSQRAAFVAVACEADQALRGEVESLLARADKETEFLETPAMAVAARAIAGAGGTRALPARVGHYRVVRFLGEGGMGVVYEAEQDQPRRAVALKLIRPGLATSETAWRFQHETQALGRLQHPGIAQIYEAGTADCGSGPQPYFAMELVRGRPVLEYAEEGPLNARERLALMADVCDAVEHAHQRGVIHRDLKPGNILVDGAGQPKILDFGVARLAGSDAQHTRQTELGQLVGTLAYMSPEQVLGDPLALDARSDVYALGVILYQLLADKLPYSIDEKPLPEAVRIVRDEEPAHLSSIRRSYRGDIDTIAAKALEKDKARRYASAAALAGDIRRYLADEPITARPASASYQLQKFARRHKTLVAGTAAVFLVLAAGVAASTLEAVRARRAERAAAAAAATSEALNDFLQKDLLAQASAYKQSDAGAKPDPDLKVRTALDRAAARIAGRFNGRPEVEAAIRYTIGQTYFDLALFPQAQEQLDRALVLQRNVLGISNPKTLSTMDHLGIIALREDQPARAEVLYRDTLETRQRVLGPDHPDTLSSLIGLASSYNLQDKYALAERLNTKAVEISRRVLGPEHPTTQRAMMGLAVDYKSQGRLGQAETLYRESTDIKLRVLGPEQPSTLNAMMGLAAVYEAEYKYSEAEALDSQILETKRRVLGPEHWDTITSMNNLAEAYQSQGKYAQSEALLSKAVEITGRVFGTNSSGYLTFTSNLADSYEGLGRHAKAEALFRQSLEISRHRLGPENELTLAILSMMASMYVRRHEYPAAETHAAQALAGYRHTLGSDHPDTMTAAADLALAYSSQRKFVESEPLAREAAEFFRRKQPDDWQRFRAESLLGASLAGQKKYSEAEPLLLSGYKGMLARRERIDATDRYYLEAAREWLVQLYGAWGRAEKAAEWRKN